MAETPEGWFPVFTLILGYAVKAAADWLQHRRTSEREREAREAARQDQLLERRTIFQRQTLLDLQDAMMQLMRTTGEMHHRGVMEFRKSGQWHRQHYGEELSENNRLAYARTTVLSVRVRDESVRNLVAAVKHHASRAGVGRSEDECERELDGAMIEFDRLNQRIGEVLRELDDEPTKPRQS